MLSLYFSDVYRIIWLAKFHRNWSNIRRVMTLRGINSWQALHNSNQQCFCTKLHVISKAKTIKYPFIVIVNTFYPKAIDKPTFLSVQFILVSRHFVFVHSNF